MQCFEVHFTSFFDNTSCEILNLDAILDLLEVEHDRQKSLTSPLHALMNEEISMVTELSEILSRPRAAAISRLSIILRGGGEDFTGRSSTLVIFVFKLCTR